MVTSLVTHVSNNVQCTKVRLTPLLVMLRFNHGQQTTSRLAEPKQRCAGLGIGKVSDGVDSLTTEQRMDCSRELLVKAQTFKGAL